MAGRLRAEKYTDLLTSVEPRFETVCQRLMAKAVTELGFRQTPDCEITRFIERPGARLIRAAFTGTDQSRVFYIKISKNLRQSSENLEKARLNYQRDFDSLTKLSKVFSGNQQFGVIKPVVFYDDLFAIVTEESSGENFFEMIEKQGTGWKPKSGYSHLESAARRCGEWLRAFQTGTANETQGHVEVEELKDYIIVRLDKLQKADAIQFGEAFSKSVLNFYDQFSSEPIPRFLVHGDYCPVNVLIDPKKVTVLDFPTIRSGPQWQDVARFVTQLEHLKYKRTFNYSLLQRMQSEFLAGYDDNFNRQDPRFQIMILQHTITHLWGRIKFREKRLTSRLFSRWVIRNHLQTIKKITGA